MNTHFDSWRYHLVCSAYRTIVAAVILFLGSSVAMAQNAATMSGYVKEAETNETLISATVAVKGTKLGALTNKSGYFVINDIPAGKHTIIASYVGYERQEIELEFAAGESKRFDIILKPSSIKADEIVVTGRAEAEKRQISISKVDIPVEQLKQLRIGGEADVFRALQSLPGILTSSQLSSGLYIRGGSPDQNLVLIDGATVYNPSHLLGFFSTFNPDAIKNVDLIKGGFPAEYGGRLSAVLDLQQKDGNQKEVEGLASLGLISSRLSLQGPIANGSWFIGGRRTYLDLILGLLPEDPEEPLPNFAFYDVNAKISQTLSDDDFISVSGFLSSDDLSLDGGGIDFNIGISNKTASTRWTHTFSDNLFFALGLSGSDYENGFKGRNSGFGFEAKNNISDYSGKVQLEWYVSNDLTIKTGVDATNYTFKYFQNLTGDIDSSIAVGSNDAGATNLVVDDWTYSTYGQANYQFTDLLSLQGGLRVDYYDFSDNVVYDPRFALRYQFQENIAVKAAWGIYHQYLRLASQPDFSFFDTWMPTDTTVSPSKATHYIVSVETEPFEGYDLNVDVYYKDLTNISEFNNRVTNAKTVADVFFNGSGEAYGAEVFLQKKAGRLTGWLGYGLGYITATFDSVNGGRDFRPKYDRRHDIKIVAQYQLDDHWDIGANFTFQSGQSYTGATSRFRSTLPGDNASSDLIVPSERYGLRLPASHQLNVNINYNSTIFDLPMRLLLDVYNVYSRRDIWFRFYDTSEDTTEVTDVRLLPIIPTVAIEVKF